MRVDRWPTAFPSALADAAMADPLSAPARTDALAADLREATGLAGLFAAAARELGCPAPGPAAAPVLPPAPDGLPRGLAFAVPRLLSALAAARESVEPAARSLTSEERALAVRSARLGDDDEAEAKEDAAVAAAARFDPCVPVLAARALAAAVEESLGSLQGAKAARRRWALPGGDLLVGSSGDDEYTEADLAGVALLVEPGGANRYRAAPAAAGPGEVRLVVDLGPAVTVEASTAAPQGPASGVLGVGLLYLAGTGGTKTLSGGAVSMGAGILGAGGLWLAGPSRVEGGAFSQGAAGTGAGAVWSAGDGSSFSQEIAGQGYATTRGAGLFVHRGAEAAFACGLTRPDPREEFATLGLCQGAGYGPRGFAGGGLGALVVTGPGARLRAGYMAQGMGYWRAAGLLSVEGDGASVVGRRYVQGAGVHTGLGLFRLVGSSASARAWGVGPGFGWDYGVGFAGAAGSSGTLAAEWASARGDVNGVGLLRVAGPGWTLALADAGSGAMRRNAPSWGLVAAEAPRLAGSAPDPWGDAPGAAVDWSLRPAPAAWPRPDRTAAASRDRQRSLMRLAWAEAGTPQDRPLRLLRAAVRGGLDDAGPREAMLRLLTAGPSAAPALMTRLTPERFDESLWVRLAFSAYGRAALKALWAGADALDGPAAAWRAAAAATLPLDFAPLSRLAAHHDWRARRGAALALGSLLSKEAGEEPGRLRVLAEAEAVCRRGVAPATKAALGARRLNDLLALLALDPAAPAADLRAVFLASDSPFDRMSPGTPPVTTTLEALTRRPAYGKALAAELAASTAAVPKAAALLRKLLADPEPEVVQAAATALAQMGDPADAPRLARLLSDPRALLREAAAAGLGRMGSAARDAVAMGLKDADPARRALFALAAAQSSDEAVLARLAEALADRDAAVRAAAVRGLNAVQEPLRGRRKALFGAPLKGMAEGDAEPAVRALAARALRAI